MSYTSAQSGDNYRNWWPHPTMTAFTNDSIDLMQSLAIETNNVFNMTDRGYVLASRRADIGELLGATDSRIDVDVYSDREQIEKSSPHSARTFGMSFMHGEAAISADNKLG